ncbi:signal peptidase II [Pseudoclavibacter sp. CFCC 13611]|uniref:signal peptidase II n=1 Tax=Pseudoclavibacter sp. CFCC 13611 TaxID=2615178 RepID=UPI0013014C0D|nr:signal peptidase II [Pseudoclavibacter sp. CFCC 13611]KAB1663391.1 signal peptidase II [Pseudoclavibacter sp. CFCC 13611]
MADSSASHEIERRASARRSILSVLGIASVAVVIDQLVKIWAIASLTLGQPVSLVGDLVQLRLVFNPGAAFSMGEEMTWVFTVLAVVVSGVLVWFSRSLRSTPLIVLFGVFLGGVVGNLIDRLFRPPAFARGHVVDFLQLKGFAIVNLADIMLTCAVIGLVLIMLFRPRQFEEVSAAAKGESSAARADEHAQ